MLIISLWIIIDFGNDTDELAGLMGMTISSPLKCDSTIDNKDEYANHQGFKDVRAPPVSTSRMVVIAYMSSKSSCINHSLPINSYNVVSSMLRVCVQVPICTLWRTSSPSFSSW